ncbi:MAG: DUF2294 domain-containing protein [Firmicutes bacterium]|jgi:uncharacterized protein YbcI|nr:DUF2294 domain-containing protein [Bacillota bacterium]
MQFRTKGELESKIGSAVMKFEREYFGRGPKEINTFIVQDMIIIRQRGILTPAEEQVRDNPESVDLIKRLRETLLKNNQEAFKALLHSVTGVSVRTLFTDISVQESEKLIVCTLDASLEAAFKPQAKRRSS